MWSTINIDAFSRATVMVIREQIIGATKPHLLSFARARSIIIYIYAQFFFISQIINEKLCKRAFSSSARPNVDFLLRYLLAFSRYLSNIKCSTVRSMRGSDKTNRKALYYALVVWAMIALTISTHTQTHTHTFARWMINRRERARAHTAIYLSDRQR